MTPDTTTLRRRRNVLGVLVLACCLLATLTGTAAAQGRGHGPGHGGPGFGAAGGPDGVAEGFHHGGRRGHHGLPLARLARHLELTDEQVESAKAIRQATEERVTPIRQAQRTLHGELRALLEADAPDASAVGAKAIELHAGREQIRALHEQAKADFEALLTAEQVDKLGNLKELRDDRRRGRRGGHGGGA